MDPGEHTHSKGINTWEGMMNSLLVRRCGDDDDQEAGRDSTLLYVSMQCSYLSVVHQKMARVTRPPIVLHVKD